MNIEEGVYVIENEKEKSREELLEECMELGLPVTKNDDIEILKLLYEAAQAKAASRKNKNQ